MPKLMAIHPYEQFLSGKKTITHDMDGFCDKNALSSNWQHLTVNMRL